MNYSSDRLLSSLFRIYRESKPQQERGEAFLEAALAAALSESGAWGNLAGHAGFDAPRGDPHVTTQDSVEDGRTDVTLHWPGRADIVLELKQGCPPSFDQVHRYLAHPEPRKNVVVVARSPARYSQGFSGTIGRYLGCATWGQIRALDWRKSPLAWRQLHHLIDEMGVAMKTVNLTQLSAISASWPAWGVLEEWATAGADAVAQALSTTELPWVTKEKKKVRTYDRWQHYSRWLWTKPWRGDGLSPTALCGFFAGRPPLAQLLVEGAPDLILVLRADPNGEVGRKLRSDLAFSASLDVWRAGSTAHVFREALLPDSQWEFLRVRSSSLLLLQSSNPDRAFADWAVARAQELIEAGVIRCLRDLELAAREAGPGPMTPAPVPDGDDGPDGEA